MDYYKTEWLQASFLLSSKAKSQQGHVTATYVTSWPDFSLCACPPISHNKKSNDKLMEVARKLSL